MAEPLAKDDDPLAAAQAWREAGHGAALATVLKTWGSAPRPAGSHLAVRDDGSFLGSVSGGCIEGAVISEALALIEAGGAQAKVMEFGVSNAKAWEVGLACGGKISVLVETVAT